MNPYKPDPDNAGVGMVNQYAKALLLVPASFPYVPESVFG
jgi:hypothetical protein